MLFGRAPAADVPHQEASFKDIFADVVAPVPCSVATQSIAADNPAILFSPYNWVTGEKRAKTNCAGAYFRVLFTGSSCALQFDVSGMGSPASQIWTQIDGYGGRTKASVAGTVTLFIPADTATLPWHLLEVWVKTTGAPVSRWHPAATAVILTGITLDAGAVVALPARAPFNLCVIGDSITEGYVNLGVEPPTDVDQSDALCAYAYSLGPRLNAEIGVIGFTNTGLTKGGAGGMPHVGAYWNLQFPGVPRLFDPAPDLLILNHGTNDAAAPASVVQDAALKLLHHMLATLPLTTKIAVLRPFGGWHAAALAAAVSLSGSKRVSYVDTSGVQQIGFGMTGGLHPTGPHVLGLIVPPLAALLQPLLAERPNLP